MNNNKKDLRYRTQIKSTIFYFGLGSKISVCKYKKYDIYRLTEYDLYYHFYDRIDHISTKVIRHKLMCNNILISIIHKIKNEQNTQI